MIGDNIIDALDQSPEDRTPTQKARSPHQDDRGPGRKNKKKHERDGREMDLQIMQCSAIALHFIEMTLRSTFIEPSTPASFTGLARGAGPHWKTSISMPELPTIIQQTSDGPGPRKIKRRGPKYHKILCLRSWGY